jgi:hypothetical protein
MAAQLPILLQPDRDRLEANFLQVLENVIGLTLNQRNIVTDIEGLTLVTDIYYMRESDLLDIFPTSGRNKLTARAKVRLVCLRNWLIRKMQSKLPHETVDPIDFDELTCLELAERLSMNEDDPNDSNSHVKLGSFNGKAEDWDDRKDDFISYLGLQRNRNNVPLRYVIRNDDERPADINSIIDRDIYQTPLTGTMYHNDNYTVYQYLRKWTIGGSAKTHVEKYERTSDGRAAWNELVSNYEGSNTIQVKILSARQTIHGSNWTHDLDNYKFEDYCKRHQKANNTMKRYGVELDGPSAVHLFLKGIQRQEYNGIKNYIIGSADTKADLQRAIEGFKEQMVSVFGYPKDQSKRNKDFRKIGGMSNTNKRNRNDQSRYNGPNKRHQSNNSYQSHNSSRSQSYSRGTQDTNDPLFIPANVLSQLNPVQKKMLFTGRDQMRNNPPNANTSTPTGRVIGAINTIPPSDVSSVGQSVPPQNIDNTNDQHVPVPQPNDSASSYFGQRRMNSDPNNRRRQQSAFVTSTRRTISSNQTSDRHLSDYSGRYRFEIDSRADTTCCGKGFIPLYDTDKVCDVSGFHASMDSIRDVPIRTCATAFDHHDGHTYILEVGQSLWFGDSLEHSLLSPNQVRSHGHELCLTPKQFSNGKSNHSIRTADHNIELNFRLHGCISYLPIREPTPKELDECIHIILTADQEWEPYSERFQTHENVFLPSHLRTVGATYCPNAGAPVWRLPKRLCNIQPNVDFATLIQI